MLAHPCRRVLYVIEIPYINCINHAVNWCALYCPSSFTLNRIGSDMWSNGLAGWIHYSSFQTSCRVTCWGASMWVTDAGYLPRFQTWVPSCILSTLNNGSSVATSRLADRSRGTMALTVTSLSVNVVALWCVIACLRWLKAMISFLLINKIRCF